MKRMMNKKKKKKKKGTCGVAETDVLYIQNQSILLMKVDLFKERTKTFFLSVTYYLLDHIHHRNYKIV